MLKIPPGVGTERSIFYDRGDSYWDHDIGITQTTRPTYFRIWEGLQGREISEPGTVPASPLENFAERTGRTYSLQVIIVTMPLHSSDQ